MAFELTDDGTLDTGSTAMATKITAVSRPFLLTFHSSGHTYPLTSDEAQRLLDEYPAVSATRNRVVLVGHNSAKAIDRSTIRPATLGGGPAFIVERS